MRNGRPFSRCRLCSARTASGKIELDPQKRFCHEHLSWFKTQKKTANEAKKRDAEILRLRKKREKEEAAERRRIEELEAWARKRGLPLYGTRIDCDD